jgi:hypothetical protein
MRSRYSMTVTSVPRRRQTEPISRPMTPPPMTASFFGIVLSESAPVESTMRPLALSTGTGGRGVGSEPDAMRMFFVVSVLEPPLVSVASTTPERATLPVPLTYSTPYFLKSYSMPPVRLLTLFVLESIILSRSTETSETMTPWCLKSFAWS